MRLVNTTLGTCFILCSAFGAIKANMPFSTLLGQADAVVVATVTGGTASGELSVNLSVERSIKGSISPGPQIQAIWSPREARNLYPSLPVQMSGKTGVWFLKQQSAAWAVIPLVIGATGPLELYLPVPTGNLPATYAYGSGAQPEQKLAMEIGAAAADSTTATTTSQYLSRGLMDDFGPDLLQPILTGLASSPQIVPRVTGVTGLIRQGAASGIIILAGMDMSQVPPSAQGFLTDAVCEYRGTDPAGVARLGTLLGAPSAKLQACAVHALREIHTKEAVPFLESSLNSSSAMIRYDAVIGIAQFAMGFPVSTSAQKPSAMAAFQRQPGVTDAMARHYPAIGVFTQNEQEYISYWRTWLRSHGLY